MIELRAYQNEAVHEVCTKLRQHDRLLISMPCGTGKTILGAYLADAWCNYDLASDFGLPPRVLWLAHRDELIEQAAEACEHFTGEPAAIEKGERSIARQPSMAGRAVVVASIQTMLRENRREQFAPDAHGLCIIDECHHAVAESYQTVLGYFQPAKVLGITATCDRTDEVPLSQFFDNVAYYYELIDGIRDGWLAPVKQQYVRLDDLDWSEVRKTGSGDLSAEDLEAVIGQEEAIHKIVAPVVPMIGDRQTLVFTPTVRVAQLVAEILPRYTDRGVRWVSGGTKDEERRAIVEAFRRREFQTLVNCFDMATELLTSDGWKGPDEISEGDLVAALPLDGQERQIRERGPREALAEPRRLRNTPRRSLPETDAAIAERYRRGESCRDIAHALDCSAPMIVRLLRRLGVQLRDRSVAVALAKARRGRSLGVLEWAPVERYVRRRRAPGERMIHFSNQTIDIRVTEGHRMLARAPGAKAWKVIRAADLVGRVGPYQLPLASCSDIDRTVMISEAECEFIGLFIADGCMARGSRGIVIGQSEVNQENCFEIERILDACRFDWKVTAKHVPNSRCRQRSYRIPLGNIGGQLKRRGYYSLEPLLDKTLSHPAFSRLTAAQLAAVVRGIWLGDGAKSHARPLAKPRNSWRIYNTDEQMLSRLQALAVVRGFAANLSGPHDNGPLATKPIYDLCLRRRRSITTNNHSIASSGGNPACIEDDWRDEEVWCVSNRHGTVVARRNGKAFIAGQCSVFLEGTDFPAVSAIVIARPTLSRMLLAQMVGRGLRGGPLAPVEGKTDCLVIDLVGASLKHKLATTADLLGGKLDAELRDEAAARVFAAAGDTPADVLEEVLAVKAQAADIRAAARAKVIAEAKATRKTIDPFVIFADAVGFIEEASPAWWRGLPPDDDQVAKLEELGIPDKGLSYTQARQLLAESARRSREGRSSYKQMRILRSRGFDPEMSLAEASDVMTHLATRPGGWSFLPEDGKRRWMAKRRGRPCGFRDLEIVYTVPAGVECRIRREGQDWVAYKTTKESTFPEIAERTDEGAIFRRGGYDLAIQSKQYGCRILGWR